MSNNKGFTLIELLIAVAAVSIILVSLAAAATRSVSVQVQARQQAQATKLAEEQLERLRAFRDRRGFAAIGNCATCYLNSATDTVITSGKLASGEFSVWMTISDSSTTHYCPSGNKRVIATAEWNPSRKSTVTACLSEWK